MPCSEIHLVAHADWSISPRKRWAACALRSSHGGWRLLRILANPQLLWEPDDPELTQIEGWIFGQSALPDRHFR